MPGDGARLAVEADGRGGIRITRLRAEPPIALRQTGRSQVTLVGSAGGPLGGDHVRLHIDIGSHASLRVCSAAATVALPGPPGSGAPSRFELAVRVGAGGHFEWRPEPIVAAHRASHEVLAEVRVEAGASAVLREVIVLGRLGEPPGTVRSRLDVTVDDQPLLRQETLIGAGGLPGWAGSAGLRGARVLGSRLVAGAAATRGDLPESAPQRSSCRLAGPGLLVTAWGADALVVAALLGDEVPIRPRP